MSLMNHVYATRDPFEKGVTDEGFACCFAMATRLLALYDVVITRSDVVGVIVNNRRRPWKVFFLHVCIQVLMPQHRRARSVRTCTR